MRLQVCAPCLDDFPLQEAYQLAISAFVLVLEDSSAFQSRGEMPLGFMARSGLIDSLMFAEVRSRFRHPLFASESSDT